MIRSHVLPDGARIDIRPIRPSDAGSLVDNLAAISAESGYRRFLSPKRTLSAQELEYLTRVDHHDHEALVALESGTDDGVGVARYVRDREHPGDAEVAITVADAWQGRGVGRVLLDQLAARAREEGVRHFTGVVLERNEPVQALLRRLGPVQSHHAGSGTAEVRVTLPEPPPRDAAR